MNEPNKKHFIDILFVIALFCIFALSSVFLITIGANIYSKTVTNMDENFITRTSLAYITEKIRQSDREQTISIGSLENQEAVIIRNEQSGVIYETYIYEYEGSLRELLIRQDTPLPASAGQPILEIKSFCVSSVNDHLLLCEIQTTDKDSCKLYISLHA